MEGVFRMEEIVKIWFEGDNIYGESKNGEIYTQSLLWYPRLRCASDSEREKYEFGLDGIHWRQLDEDISFESFGYDDAEPTVLQRFFLTHPELDVCGVAKSLNMDPILLNNYINGLKKPDKNNEIKILDYLHQLEKEMLCLMSENTVKTIK